MWRTLGVWASCGSMMMMMMMKRGSHRWQRAADRNQKICETPIFKYRQGDIKSSVHFSSHQHQLPASSSSSSSPRVQSEKRRRGRPRISDSQTHLDLRICVLEDQQSDVLSISSQFSNQSINKNQFMSLCQLTVGFPLCSSVEEESRAGAAVSSWAPGGGLPGPAEVHLPPADGRRTLRSLHRRPSPEASPSAAPGADAGGDQQQHQGHRSREVGPLHPPEGPVSFPWTRTL